MRGRTPFMSFDARKCVMTKKGLLAICLVLMPVGSQADIYLWQDAQGAPRFSEMRPGEGAREVRKLRMARRFSARFGAGQFRTASGDGTSDDGVWWWEQRAGTNRPNIVKIAVEGRCVHLLPTEPGDSDVSGSGPHERN